MKLNHPSPLPVINSEHVQVTQDWDRLIQILISKEIDFFFVDTSFIRDVPRSEEWEKVINSLNKNYNKTKKSLFSLRGIILKMSGKKLNLLFIKKI